MSGSPLPGWLMAVFILLGKLGRLFRRRKD